MQEKVREFLKVNDVKRGWQNLILESKGLTEKLGKITDDLPSPYTYKPEYGRILNAFSHAEPGNIKVVIIGTSPAATRSIANGLAFSSDRNDGEFHEGQAIYKVHRALREAKILAEDGDYYCGHKEWAKKGVLLLNAALTITEAENESAHDIRSHYKIWKEFLQELLLEWLIKTPISHKLFVMRWGYAPSDNMTNYAEDVWNNVHEHKDVVEKNIHPFPVIHHPTFPSPKFKVQNNFLIEAPGHFKIIKEEYKTIFSLEPVDSVDDIAERTQKLSLNQSHRVR